MQNYELTKSNNLVRSIHYSVNLDLLDESFVKTFKTKSKGFVISNKKKILESQAKKALTQLQANKILRVDFRLLGKVSYREFATELADNAWSHLGNLENSGTTSESFLSANSANVMAASEVNLGDCLRTLPKYNETDFEKFDSCINKLKQYFPIVRVSTDADKITLLEYAVAEHDHIRTICQTVQNLANGNFDTYANKAIELLDGRISYRAVDIIAAMYELKLNDFHNLKYYFQEFLNLKAKAGSGEQIDESFMVEGFIRGCPMNMKQNLRMHDKKTLLENYQLAEKMYEQKKPVSINGIRQSNSRNNNQNNGQNKPKKAKKFQSTEK